MLLPDFLIDRYKEWKKDTFDKNSRLYKKTSVEPQKPKAMIISCCDSRVNETSIFNGEIGDFFIHRNIANIVPTYNLANDHYNTLSSIEYAVCVLKVPHLIVMGHSNCGGIKYGYEVFCENNKIENLVYLNEWIKNLSLVYKDLNKNTFDKNNIKFLEMKSVINSISNLQEYPFIKDLVSRNKLSLHGIWYDISNGTISQYDNVKGKFDNIIY